MKILLCFNKNHKFRHLKPEDNELFVVEKGYIPDIEHHWYNDQPFIEQQTAKIQNNICIIVSMMFNIQYVA